MIDPISANGRRALRVCALLIPLIALGASAAAMPGATEIPWWDDPYEITDLALRAKLRSHGLWISESQVACAGVTCSLELDPYLFLNNDPATPLCPDLEVYGLPHGTGYGGVLVGDDLFLTVHAVSQASCDNRSIVFGLAAESVVSPLLDPLAPGQTLTYSVPAADVYSCEEVLGGGGTVGWTLVRLDRPVIGRRPLKLHRSGLFGTGVPTVTAGYPNRLPLKVEDSPLSFEGSAGGANEAHVLGGSSGSLVLAPSSRLLGVVCCGATGWWLDDGGCYRPDPAANARASFDRPIDPELALVPAIGLDVTLPHQAIDNPLLIDHYGPPGGPFTYERMPHRLEAGAAGLPTDWTLVLLSGGPLAFFRPEPGAPTSGSLAPGEKVSFDVVATPAAYAAGVGVYADALPWADLTYQTTDLEMHRLFVGVDSFELECVRDNPGRPCDDRFLGETGPSGAVYGESKLYQVTSRWEVSQTIDVGGPPWLSFEGPGGVAGNPIAFELTAGESAEVAVTVVFDTTVGTVEDEIDFESSFAGQPMHSEQVLVRGDLGRILIESEPDLGFAPGTTVEYPLSLRVPDYPVTDFDLCLTATGAEGPAPVPQDPPSFRIRSSNGQEVSLSAAWGFICWSDELFDPPPRVRVVGVPGLASVEGDPLGGTWTLVIESPDTKLWETGTLEFVSFRFQIAPP